MSQLIKLREQIKTIRTIQKITQAMRLVSMSVHSRLNNQKNYLKNYQLELNKISQITNLTAHAPVLEENLKTTQKTKLIVLIGSQKGLCGAFNQDVLRAYSNYHKTQPKEPFELVVIGKKLIDTVQRKYQIDRKILRFTPSLLNEIVDDIFNHVFKTRQFSEVLFISNSAKNFFAHHTKITPLLHQSNQPKNQPTHSDKGLAEPYIWEQPAQELAQVLYINQLKLNIYCLLFESLIAEYSARFRSMDKATRNATTLLETTERQYRKVRQTKITRELVELSAIFQTK